MSPSTAIATQPSAVGQAPYGTMVWWPEPTFSGSVPFQAAAVATYESRASVAWCSGTSMWRPWPSRRRAAYPAIAASAAHSPAARSPIGTPARTGAPPGSPVTPMIPASACTVRSKAGSPARAEPDAKPVTLTTTRCGWRDSRLGGSHRRARPASGRKFSITTSARASNASSAAPPSTPARSRTIPRLPVLSAEK